MIRIKGTTIWMTRGDTLEVPVIIKTQSGDPYIPAQGDVIRFAMKKEFSDAEPLLVKIIPNNTLILRLEHEDTKDLEVIKKAYVYDIELTTHDGTVDTFIATAHLYLLEEVY